MDYCCICHGSAHGPQILFGYCNASGVAISLKAVVFPVPRFDAFRFCGQGCALVAVERYLDRGSFDPAPEAIEARPVDALAELT